MLPILLVGIGLVVGCSEAPPPEEAATPVRAASADPEVCAEHGVLEAVCPKCNPRLAAVFQAKGDWCDEHGFPESFCPICRPEQGGRPVAEVSGSADPADGLKVRFRTREAADLAGIEVVEAVAADFTSGTTAVARITWDATRTALVSARAPGIVTGIEADVGSPVQPGAPLATVRSAHVGGDRSRVAAAASRLEVAEAELARKQELLAAGVSSRRDVLVAEQEVASARGELGALRAELGLVGGGGGDVYTLTAPSAGIVVERHAAVGLSVDGGQPLFQIVDPSRMWAELDVAEADLGLVAAGQTVHLTLDALPDRTFDGTIDFVSPALDPSTRTARARVALDNPDGALRANMYGTARIVTAASRPVVTVPSAAVQRAGEVHLVFVRAAVDEYVARRVTVVAREGDRVRITGPVQPGDPVATSGSFLLKTETLKDSIGAGCCDVE